MITKEDFYSLTDDEAINYIIEHYCMDDVNDACTDSIADLCEDEDEYDELMDMYQPLQIVSDSLSETDLKDYLWETVIEQCEEIDENYEPYNLEED